MCPVWLCWEGPLAGLVSPGPHPRGLFPLLIVICGLGGPLAH